MTKRIKIITAVTFILNLLTIGLFLSGFDCFYPTSDFHFLIIWIAFFSNLLNIILIVRNIRKKGVKKGHALLSLLLGIVGLLVPIIIYFLSVLVRQFCV